MATKYEYYDSGDDWRAIISASTTAIAQTFTPSIEHAISKVVLKLYRIGNPGNITVKIQGVDGSNDPDGVNLVTATTDGNTLTTGTGGEWRTITFSSNPTLDSGTQYAIVITVAGADGSNKIAWRNNSSGTYTGGKYTLSLDSGGAWDDGGGDTDCMFEEWGVDVPSKPITPSPGHTNTEVDFSDLTLSWADGGGADTYDVWIGDSVGLSRVSIGQEGTSYITNLDEISSAYGDKIYWRIDAVNDAGTTEGNTWYFDAQPGQVSTFTPLNEATGLILSAVGSTWDSPSGNTDSYNIYFGIESGSLFLVDNTVDLLLDLIEVFPTYNYTYYWKIDAVNDFGITLGNEVYFTTDPFYPPLPTGVTLDGDGNPTGTPTGESGMITIKKLVAAANNKIWYESI